MHFRIHGIYQTTLTSLSKEDITFLDAMAVDEAATETLVNELPGLADATMAETAEKMQG